MTSLGDRAADDLRFIRDAMARTATFTAVPGVGGLLIVDPEPASLTLLAPLGLLALRRRRQ